MTMNQSKVDFAALLASSNASCAQGLVRLETDNAPVGIFYGLSSKRAQLAFLTKAEPVSIPSTSAILVQQWEESEGVWWTSFILQDERPETQFDVLAGDLIEAALSMNTERDALFAIKNCFHAWRIMFRATSQPMTDASYQGLFGELFFLENELIPKLGIDSSISAWSGPELTAKDFSSGRDWWEIKTIGASSPSVTISSVQQLSSDDPGTLVIVRTERMSAAFDNGKCTVGQLFETIRKLISDNAVLESFLQKVESYGYTAEADRNRRFKVATVRHYNVCDGFPRIREKDMPFDAITAVSYDLSIPGIKTFCKE